MSRTISSMIVNLGLVAVLFGLGWHFGLNMNKERLITQAEKSLRAQKVRTRLWMLGCIGYLFIYFYLSYRRPRNQN